MPTQHTHPSAPVAYRIAASTTTEATTSIYGTVDTPVVVPDLLRRWRGYKADGYGKKSPEIRSMVRQHFRSKMAGKPQTNRFFRSVGPGAFALQREKYLTFGRSLAKAVGTSIKQSDVSALTEFLTANMRTSPLPTGNVMAKLNVGLPEELLSGESLFVCSHCARTVSVTNVFESFRTETDRWVAACCAEHYDYSEHQEEYFRASEAVEVEHLISDDTGETEMVTVSAGWADNHCRHVGERYVTNALYNYIRRHGDRTAQAARWRGQIGGYHSSVGLLNLLPSALFDSREIPLRAGIELEIEVGDNHNTQDAATDVIGLLNKAGEFALAEQDGSLRHGFEVVTRYGGLDVMTEKLAVLASPEFKALVKKYKLRSHDTTTCGLHVTIDRANMSKLHQGKLRVFANAPQNKQLFLSVCRRYLDSGERYARVKPVEFNRISKSGKASTGDRYEMFNLTKSRVIEFRGPKGTLKYESVIAAIEFARMCWFFTRDTALSQLDTGTFLEYIVQKHLASETKFLRQYLIEHKLLAAPIPESASESRRLNLREALFDAITAGHIAVPSEV